MSTLQTVLSIVLPISYYLTIGSVAIRIIVTRRNVSSAMAWLLVIIFLPLVGAIAYFLIGELKIGRKRVERAQTMLPMINSWFAELMKNDSLFSKKSTPLSVPLMQLCEQRQNLSATQNESLQLYTFCDAAAVAMIKDIEQAQEKIDIVFYIWSVGGIADDVGNALIAASQRGVRCRIMLDSAGSRTFFRSSFLKKMRTAGITVIEVLKVSLLRALLRRMDLRQHRKIMIIDESIAYTGSMNMVDPRFFKQNIGIGQWIDIMVRIKGPIAIILSAIYCSDWELETGEHTLPSIPEELHLPFQNKEHIVQCIPSGPGFPEDIIQQSLTTVIYSARQQLIMTTPYLVPSDSLLDAICTAALRGVDVIIIVPQRGDSIMANWAGKSFYSQLLKAGVKIYTFTGGLLHTKSILVDQQLSLVGTVNLDIRSLRLNFEITVAIDDPIFGEELAQLQADYMEQSELIDLKQWRKRPMWHRFKERLFYFFSPLL